MKYYGRYNFDNEERRAAECLHDLENEGILHGDKLTAGTKIPARLWVRKDSRGKYRIAVEY